MSRPLFTNNAATSLALPITPLSTVLQVTAGTGGYFPQPSIGDYFMLTLVQANNPSVAEIVECIGRSGDILTVVRGQEGTAPQTFNLSDNVELRITASSLNLFAIGGGSGGTASGTSVADFTATAGQTVFTLPWSYTQGIDNLAIFVNGSKQIVNVNFVETSTTSFTMASGLNVGDLVEAIYNLPLSGGIINSSNVVYNEGSAGAVNQTVQDKLQEVVSVKDFGAVGDGVTDNYNALLAAWNYAYPIGANLYFPSGTYLVITENFPFRNTQVPVTSLLDCNNMTIYGEGPSSILKTSSVLGADVLQLNGLKNFHVRNLQVQSVVSGTSAGSNGISITGGFDNLTFDNILMKNLGYVDKTTYVDGGKALTIQPATEANPITMGSIKATNIIADGCVYGFGYEPDNDLALTQPISIDVDIVVMNSRQGVILSGAESTAALSANSTSGVRVRGQSINCMQDVVASRTFGVDIDMQIIQTKTVAQLLLSYTNSKWVSNDTTASVIGLFVAYARNSRFAVYGNKKECEHKAKIGGAGDPNTGLGSATNYCDFYLNIAGTSTGVDIQFSDSGGNILNNSRLYCTTSTALNLPIEFYDPTKDNTLTIGPDTRLQNVDVTTQIGWTEADGRTVYHNKYLLGGNLSTRQTVGSAVDIIVEQWTDHLQARKFAIRNDGAILSAGRNVATSVATVKGVLPIYDEVNVLVGYVPIYTTFA